MNGKCKSLSSFGKKLVAPTDNGRRTTEKKVNGNAHKHRLVKVFENLANYSKHLRKLLHKGRFAVCLYSNEPEYRWLTGLIFAYCEFSEKKTLYAYRRTRQRLYKFDQYENVQRHCWPKNTMATSHSAKIGRKLKRQAESRESNEQPSGGVEK